MYGHRDLPDWFAEATRSIIPTLATALVVACDAEVVAPSAAVSASEAARAVTSGLSTWPVSPSVISMSWPDGVANEAGWEVHRSTAGPTGSFVLRVSLPANTTSWTDSTLDSQMQYCYKVRSFKNSGGKKSFAAFSSVSCSTTFGAPAAPSQVAAVPRTSSIVDITWVDNADDELAFRVERAADPAGPWQTVATLAPYARSFADVNSIEPDQQLCYRVVATNAGGESSSTVDCTAAPRGPSSIAATSADAQSIDVSWVDASTVEDGYELQRRLAYGAWQVVANLAANANGFHDAAVVSDTVYEYRVRATRDGGFSDSSGSVTMAAVSRAPDAVVLKYVIPSDPVVVVGFSAAPLATEFRIERSSDGQGTWLVVADHLPNSDDFYDYGLFPEQEVCYRVFARNRVGDSPPSNVACATSPASPSDLAFTTDADGTRRVTWTDNSNIESGYLVLTYFCYEDHSSCTYEYETIYPPNTASIVLGGDGFGRLEYFLSVCAMYGGGTSPCLWFYNASATSAASSGLRATPAPKSWQALRLSPRTRRIP
jgi:hypothetical protein